MRESAVRSYGLTKRFRRQVAVDAIDLAVPRGSVYGFLGPNGSGKTTTIRLLLGLIRPTAGRHELLGRPLPQQAGAVLSRLYAHVKSKRPFAMISAEKDRLTPDENEVRTMELVMELKAAGLGGIQVVGLAIYTPQWATSTPNTAT